MRFHLTSLVMKLSVDSSKPSANMMIMMPSSANCRINGPLSSGNTLVFTRTQPMKRKYKTGVIRVFFAMTTAANTATQIIARCVNGSILSVAKPLQTRKTRSILIQSAPEITDPRYYDADFRQASYSFHRRRRSRNSVRNAGTDGLSQH